MRLRQSWLWMLPAVGFLAAALLLSCGKSKSPTPVATPAPPGAFVQSICVLQGTPVPPTPTPPAGAPTPTPATFTCPSNTPSVLACSQYPFHAIASFSDGSNGDITNSCAWNTQNPMLSSVGDGLYTAKCCTSSSPNQTTGNIIATAGGVSGILSVTVTCH
jgi:hypothetical protein